MVRPAALALCATIMLAGAGPAGASDKGSKDDEFWATVSGCTSAEEVRLYIKKFPGGRHVAKAKACLRKLEMAALQKRCAAHAAAGRLYGAGGKTAAGCYREMLKRDPRNAAARTGLRRIGATIASRARAALRRGDIAVARRLLGTLKREIPGAPGAGKLEAAIAEARRRQNIIVMKPGRQFQDCPFCPQMIALPAGSFTMGSPASEAGRQPDEDPQRAVRFRTQFAVSRHEITFAQWDACEARGGCGGYRPGDAVWGRGNRPVINVSWGDAQRYVGWLSALTGRRYRLLTEAEWEYAARAGSRTAYSWGNAVGSGRANCRGCGGRWGGRKTANAGSFPANRFGLHDMHGNVREWVQDCWQGSYRGAAKDGRAYTGKGSCGKRVKRGGSWRDRPHRLRSASRLATKPKGRDRKTGFRVAVTLER